MQTLVSEKEKKKKGSNEVSYHDVTGHTNCIQMEH